MLLVGVLNVSVDLEWHLPSWLNKNTVFSFWEYMWVEGEERMEMIKKWCIMLLDG